MIRIYKLATMEIEYHNIEKETIKNTDYRRVLYTVPKSMQLVLMSIPPKQNIHNEVHSHTSQFIKVESGLGIISVSQKRNASKSEKKNYALGSGVSVIIPPGTWHKIESVGKTPLKLYTIYTPPEHRPGLIQKNRPKE